MNEVDVLNELLDRELAAVEAYRRALDDHREQTQVIPTLMQGLESHRHRTDVLIREIRGRGGDPKEEGGLRSNVARLVEEGASLLGLKAGLQALLLTENNLNESYEKRRDRLVVPELASIAMELATHQEDSQPQGSPCCWKRSERLRNAACTRPVHEE
ncbi:MAG: hypothetical protein HC927_11845 [Deltaproteobacteria bacterium]|nr:hypothetical protein [Deltaproteobacteria bacterium]